MNKKELLARAERRRKLARIYDYQPSKVSDDIDQEIGMYWLQLAVSRWDPRTQKEVPPGIPVGKEQMTAFVESFIKDNGFKTRKWNIAGNGAASVARWIDLHSRKWTGIDYPNPITEVEKSKGESKFVVRASLDKQAETAYTDRQVEHPHRNYYGAPDEHPRHCPEHPGVMLKRVRDGVYQCSVGGETWADYEGGHEVTFEKGVHHQTNMGWNDSFSQPPFLAKSQQSWEDPELESYGEDKDHIPEEEEGLKRKAQLTKAPESIPVFSEPTEEGAEPKLIGEMNARRVYDLLDQGVLEWVDDQHTAVRKRRYEIAENVRSFVRKAKVEPNDKMFGPVQVQTRYCPDHPGTMLARVADKVYQCPLDKRMYDFSKGFETDDGEKHLGGDVAEMTPDRPEMYTSMNALVEAGLRAFVKRALYERKGPKRIVHDPREMRVKRPAPSGLEAAVLELQQYTGGVLSPEEARKVVQVLQQMSQQQALDLIKRIKMEGSLPEGIISQLSIEKSAKKEKMSFLREYRDKAAEFAQNPDISVEEMKGWMMELLEDPRMDERSREENLPGIMEATSKKELLEHFWYMLMKFEDAGVLRLRGESKRITKEAATPLETRFAYDLAQMTARGQDGLDDIRKQIVDGVLKQGLGLLEAINNAYLVVDAGKPGAAQPEPQEFEVESEEEIELPPMGELGR